MAQPEWWIVVGVLCLLGGALLGGGVADALLYLNSLPSISDYLRGHPVYFWLPAALLQLFLLGLYLHLFVFTE